jgi:hypothetical protein
MISLNKEGTINISWWTLNLAGLILMKYLSLEVIKIKIYHLRQRLLTLLKDFLKI